MKKIIALTLALSIVSPSVPAIGATAGQRYCAWATRTLGFNSRTYYNLCMKPYVGTGWGIDFINRKRKK